jgi:hypothetical protein
MEWPIPNIVPAEGNNNLADALKQPSKTLYVIGCVYYRALNKNCYFAEVCVTWDSTPGTSEEFPLCTDPQYNYPREMECTY